MTLNLGRVHAEEDAGRVPRGSVDSRTSEKPMPFGQEEQSVDDGIAPPQRILFPPEKICMAWQQPLNVGVGLENLGNTCYLNAALQCLTHTPPLANYMLSCEHSKSCHAEGFCMMCTLEAHINKALLSSNNTIAPLCVIFGLSEIGSHFRYGSQEDAHEFLSLTVDALQRACLNGSTTRDASSEATTLIYQIFGGYLRSQVKCLSCEAVSDRHEPFLNITLDIETVTSVTEALEQFVTPEQLGGENSYKCSKCKNMVLASKRYTIHRSSRVLILSLKRFADFTGGKINKDVKYPEYLDLRAYMSQPRGEPLIYSLYAVLVHSGFNCSAGHYTSFVKAGNGFWYHMNDAVVELCDIETVLSQQAYLLFYIRRCDLPLGERGFYLPAPSYPRSFLGQRGPNSKQAGFMGPRLPPHMIKNSSRLNGNGPLKEDTNPVGITIKRPSSAPPTACIQNWAITRPSAMDPSKAQKITISIHNKLPECQTVSQPDCLTSALENEDLSKAVPSCTITNSFRAESTSNASTVAVAANISKQEVPDEMFVEPEVNGRPTLGSDAPFPSSAESSGKSEASNGVFKMNCNISSNGIVIGKVVGTLQNSHSFCESAEEESSHRELPQNDSLNGAISLDIGSTQNGLKLDDFACQGQPAKPSEIFFAKTNGLLEPIPVAESPIPQEIILESLAYSHLNRLSEKTSVPAPLKSEGDRLMETRVTEPVFGYQQSRTPLSDLGCEIESPFTLSVSETIATKEVAQSILTKADNVHPSINGQHKVRKNHLATEDEYLGQCESEDNRDKDKPRRPKEPALIAKGDPSYIKGSAECEEKLGQISSVKSGIECSRKHLASLGIRDQCQDRKDISGNYAVLPPFNESSITKLDRLVESEFSRQNEGLNNRKCEEDNRQKHEEKRHDSRKTDKEHYRKKRQYSDITEQKQSRSKVDDRSYKRRHSCSMETNKQHHPKQDYCNESKYRPCHHERNSPSHGKSSGKCSRHRSRSRERTEQDRNRYYHSKGDKTWSRDRYCQGDTIKMNHLSSHRGNSCCCSVPQQQCEKHSRERRSPPPASAHAQSDNSFWEKEKLRLGKRKCGDPGASESEMGKKCRKIDDKLSREGLQDLDGLVLRIDNDNRKRKKKKKKKKHIRKLKDFSEYLGSHLERTTQEKTVPIFSGNYSHEQYRNQGSEEPYNDRKPSGADDNKKCSFIPSSDYIIDAKLTDGSLQYPT